MVGIAIPTSMAVMAIGSGAAWAQMETCPSTDITDLSQLPIKGFPGYMTPADAAACRTKYPGTPGCFRMDGSDTLTNIAQAAIKGSHACLSYHNIGSSQGEANMLFGGGISGLSSRAATAYQGFAPMSRNYTSNILANSTGATWAPDEHNVVAIDAGVFAFWPKTGGCVNLNDKIPSSCSTQCASAITNNVSGLAVLVGGSPASGSVSKGTTAECSDPCRTCLLGYLISPSCEDVSGTFQHIYRRDDKSGTQDTFREKITDASGNPVKFWCNGKSEGDNGNPGGNIKNEDLDPVRTSCVGDDGTHAYSKCTHYPLKYTCKFGDSALPANSTVTRHEPTGASYSSSTGWTTTYSDVSYTNPYSHDIPCTQGVVVALSENDPGSDDITISIGNRVKTEGGLSIGLAGKAAQDLISPPNVAVNINTITVDPGNIYPGAYKFSRRLFFQRNAAFTDSVTSSTDQVAGRKAEETLVWNYATNTPCSLTPAIKTAGFLDRMEFGCADNCTSGSGSTSEGGILTCASASAGAGTPKQNVGAEGETCPTKSGADSKCYPFVGNGILYGDCTVDGTNNACTAGGTSPYPTSTYPKL
jgi:hypothetical protein